MKIKRCLGLFIWLCLIQAQVVWAAGNSGKAEISFSQGLMAYSQKQYQSAAHHFKRTLDLNPQHQVASYFVGMSLFYQKKQTEALVYLKKQLEINKADPEPQLYIGIIHYQLGQKALAENYLKMAHKRAKGETRILSEKYLAQLDRKKSVVKQQPSQSGQAGKSKVWFVTANLGSNFDSNATLDPSDLTIASLPSDKNDFYFFLKGGLGVQLLKKSNYRLLTEASYTQTLYAELDQFNYGLSHVELRQDVKLGNLYWQPRLGYEFSTLGTDKYLQSIFLSQMLQYTWSQKSASQLSLKLKDDLFFDEPTTNPQNRDAWNFLAEFGQSFYFGANKAKSIRLAYQLERNFAQGNDWEYFAHTIKASFFTPLFWELKLYLFGDVLVDKSFDYVDSVIGTKRNDYGVSSGVYLSRKVKGPLEASLNYNFYHNSSNQDFFTYDKHQVGITFSVNY